ncbi:MAG TPA: hypothetical protein VKD88_07240 [Gaiellaceae bacterium]|nr:hypothetical protein [Gaiellaceae bacterium]
MARRQESVTLPAFPGIALKRVELAKGYAFGKPRGGKVEIFKEKTRAQAREKTGATLECVCSGGNGGCEIFVEGGIASCTNDTCNSCTWRVRVPSDAFVVYLSEVFQP